VASLASEAPERTLSAADQGSVEKLRDYLRAGMHSPKFQPPILPQTALQLLDLSRDPDVSLTRVRELMEHEPALAAKVMSTAQSAMYSRGTPVDSLEDALVRLGVKRVAGIFLEAAMRATVMGSKAFERPLEQLRKHCVATGHIARGVCRSLQLPGERAFVCGLLHDVGVSGCYLLLSNMPKEARPKRFEIAAEAVRLVHEEASRVMGDKWQLPFGIRWVVGHHHSLWVDGRINPLAAVVNLSDWLAAQAGADGLAEASEEQALQAAKHFGLSTAALDRLKAASRQIVEQLP
jgi:HD-like signal output (HDOD) protein